MTKLELNCKPRWGNLEAKSGKGDWAERQEQKPMESQ